MKHYKYEVALSYSHKDEDKKVADIIVNELKTIFADKVFQDYLRPEELFDANVFKNRLREIFRDTRYAIILYSEGYEKGEFTKIELEEILNIAHKAGENNFCIINLTNQVIGNQSLKDLFYISLESAAEQDKICEIVETHIKHSLILKSVNNNNQDDIYRLNIQTLFMYGNLAQWKPDYNWNILTQKFITSTNGRKIETGYTWEELWNYIKKDFLLIKKELNHSPNKKMVIFLNCHLSIAYKLGQIYGDLNKGSGNRNLTLISSNRANNLIFEISKERNEQKYEIVDLEKIAGNDENSADIVCVISIKPFKNETIIQQVQRSLKNAGIKYSSILLFQKEMTVTDGDNLEDIADYINKKMQRNRVLEKEKSCTIHLFFDTLVPLAFVLGGHALFPGEINLYEFYDTEENYVPSLSKNKS